MVSGSLTAGGVEVSPLLSEAEARFYSERCYLTQARLGRLLEIYQSAQGRTDTPLTRFIKDLLRLDRLDALVDGLRAVGDKRNLRKLVPAYAEFERQLATSQARVVELQTTLDSLQTQLEGLRELLLANARELGIAVSTASGESDTNQWQRLFTDEGTIESELTLLTGARRELSSAQQRFQAQVSPDSARAIADAELAAATAAQRADEWHSTTGMPLEVILDDLRELLPDISSIASSGPTEAFESAVVRASAELDRCSIILAKDVQDRASLELLAERVAQSEARLTAIDSQIEEVGSGGDLEALTRALSELVAHVHGEDCPVCGRDFTEVSAQPLRAALTSRIAGLSESAARLQALIVARSEASLNLRTAQDQGSRISAQLLTDPDSRSLQRRAAALRQNLARLRASEARVSEGADILRTATETATTLARANEANRAASEVDVIVSDVAASIGLATPEIASAGQKLLDARAFVDARISALEARSALLARARAAANQLSVTNASVQEAAAALDAEVSRADSTMRGLATAEQRREIAKLVANKAITVRTSIARDVFNDSLNKLWRELFIRLAPGEPYVPAFRLPTGPGTGIIAELQTVHRDGDASGSPQAMLSAGNLNTAALTLFLALHLSAVPQLPCLILDDPVQSMDELHVAQLAALLRTISRQHQRQVILAVHERPLFDYLSLELSPGRPNDRLITVELSRERGGDTLVRPNYLTFEEDRAVSAA